MRDVAGNTPFWDSGSLSGLKQLSQTDDPQTRKQAAREAAQYFEGLFFQMMMKSAKPVEGQRESLFNSQAMNSFQDMFESQVSLNAGRRGTGLARVIEQQLLGKGAATAQETGGALQTQQMVLPLPLRKEIR